MNKARFESFADAVFAFAITLLALGFVLPRTHLSNNQELAHALLGLWPNLVAYVLSFSVIGIMWQNHHALFRFVRTVDRRTVFWNLSLLASTVLIPFATTTLGSYPTFAAASFLYGAVLSACAVFYNLMLLHLVRSHSFEPEVTQATLDQTVRGYRMGLIIYMAATLIALALPLVSFGLYLVVVMYFLVPRGADSDVMLTARRW